MKSDVNTLFVLLIMSLVAVPPARAADKIPNAQLRASGKLGARLLREFKKSSTKHITPGVLARVKGNLYMNFPELDTRPVSLSQWGKMRHKDPTFRGTHPMFKRLVQEGWYSRSLEIEGLQQQADELRQGRMLAPTTPLSEVTFISFDLETNQNPKRYGKFDRTKKRLLSDTRELTQFGYTVYKGGQVQDTGSFDIRPSGAMDPKVQKFTGLTPERLASAQTFEQVAGKILTLLKGRVMIGQGIQHRDWVWLQSNFARLGVDLPGPRQLMLDTRLMSFNRFAGGMGLKGLCDMYGTPLKDHHDAQADSRTAGDLFYAMMKSEKISTLDQAEAFQGQGLSKMSSPNQEGN